MFERTLSNTFHIRSSEYSTYGSKLPRMVVANKKGNCGIKEIFDLNVGNGTFTILIPSISILPSVASHKRSKAEIKEDLPAPVRPHIPNFSFG